MFKHIQVFVFFQFFRRGKERDYRDRDRDRSDRRGRRSYSPDVRGSDRKRRRSRSRSRDRERDRERERREEERKKREEERRRRQSGLPVFKKEHVIGQCNHHRFGCLSLVLLMFVWDFKIVEYYRVHIYMYIYIYIYIVQLPKQIRCDWGPDMFIGVPGSGHRKIGWEIL